MTKLILRLNPPRNQVSSANVDTDKKAKSPTSHTVSPIETSSKRSLQPNEGEENKPPSKRLKLIFRRTDTSTSTPIGKMDIEHVRKALCAAIPQLFPKHFERLLDSNYTDIDNWVLPNHHRFMAALCQSVQEVCIQQGIDTISTDHVNIDLLFQDALQTIAAMAAEEEADSPLNQFLQDQDHVAYRDMLEEPKQFEMRAAETEKIFNGVAEKLKRLVPGLEIEGNDMWKLCVDPQVIKLLEQKNIRADAPLIGRFLFEGEKNFLYNMARSWEFIVDAALEKRPFTLQFHAELNALCTSQTLAEDADMFPLPDTREFLLLKGHTLSEKGKEMLEQTVASLREHGLDAMLNENLFGKLECHELKLTLRNEKDVKALQKWMEACVKDHQEHSQHLQGDALALQDIKLAIKLNQAHFYWDGNIRTNQQLLNFLRLCRGEKPFMFAEPNVLDGHTPQELLAKREDALVGRIKIPASSVKTSMQARLLTQEKQGKAMLVGRQLNRNVPCSHEYLQYREHMREHMNKLGMWPVGPLHFNDFITFLRNHGQTFQKLKTTPVEYFKMRRAYLTANSFNENESAMIQGRRLMTQCSTYLFPKLDVTEIITTLIEQGQFENTAAPGLFKPLWDLQEYLHLCPDGGATNLESFLKPDLEKSYMSMEEARECFLKRYEGFEEYRGSIESGEPLNIAASLKRKLALVFFPSVESINEDKFLQKYCIFLGKKIQEGRVSNYLAAINEIKADKRKHGLDEIFFSKIGSDFQKFIDILCLYGSHRNQSNATGTALSYMGYFLFPKSKAMEIFDDLMKNEFKGLQKDANLRATMWDLELFLRNERSINGIEALRDGGIEEGHAHIEQFALKYQDTLTSFSRLGVLKNGLMRCIFPGYQKKKVQQDIEDLQKFITRKSTSSSPPLRLYDELQEKISPSGWPDSNLGEFLDFRKKTLLDRNKTINPMDEPSTLTGGGTNFFNLLTLAAQQRYPALRQFFPPGQTPANVTKLTYVVLNFLTHLRDKRKENDTDIDAFHEDVNEKSINEFLQNQDYRLPNIFATETLKQLLSKFAKLPSIDKIQPGVDLAILNKAQYHGEKVEQDIEDLKNFIKSKDKAVRAFSPYRGLFTELQNRIGESGGWSDGNLGEFLDCRRKILLDRNKTINPTKDADNPVTSFFNLLTIAAHQRYPALRQFILSTLDTTDDKRVTLYTHFVLNFLTRLRDERRKNGADIDAFHEDVNEENINEFWNNKEYKRPHTIAKEKFKLLMLQLVASLRDETLSFMHEM
jgi:hypothetical protein